MFHITNPKNRRINHEDENVNQYEYVSVKNFVLFVMTRFAKSRQIGQLKNKKGLNKFYLSITTLSIID